MNDGLHHEIAEMKICNNQLKHNTKKNCIVISGVKETFAERTDDCAPADNPPLTTREDRVSTVCSVRSILETCKLTVTSSDVKSVYRLKTKRPEPYPILVTFHTTSQRDKVVKSST